MPSTPDKRPNLFMRTASAFTALAVSGVLLGPLPVLAHTPRIQQVELLNVGYRPPKIDPRKAYEELKKVFGKLIEAWGKLPDSPDLPDVKVVDKKNLGESLKEIGTHLKNLELQLKDVPQLRQELKDLHTRMTAVEAQLQIIAERLREPPFKAGDQLDYPVGTERQACPPGVVQDGCIPHVPFKKEFDPKTLHKDNAN